jgi:5-methylthioadenosine/S-adenosylhomocysteine deaminase
MFEEMRIGAFLQKLARNDATVMPVQTMLDMATRFSASVLNLDNKVGSLEIGKQADIILVDLDQPHLWPIVEGARQNIEEQIVYSASAGDVSHTIVAGKILMADRKVLTLDKDEAFLRVQEQTAFLLKKAGLV